MTGLLNSLFGTLSPLWEMSLTAAYVTAVVVLLRLVLKKRAPRQMLCLLWLVVFARLLIPVSLESPLSIVPDAQQVQLVQQPAQGHGSAHNPAPGQADGVTVSPVSQDSSSTVPVLTAPSGTTPAVARPEPQAGFPWQALLAGVWLAGALAMGGYGLISYLRLKSRLYDAIRATDGAWEHPNVGSPFILGVLRPRIYLPAGLYGQPRKFILCHERAHLRRLDHIVKPICWLALALHWFNPFVWAAFILMSRDIEAACDEAVIRQLGPKVKADYSETLLSLATNGRVPAPCPLAFDEGDAKGRIKNVLRYRRPALWIVVVSAVMAVMAAVCLLTDPVSAQSPGDPDPDESASQAPDQGLNALLDPWMEEVLNGERTFRSGAEEFNISQLRTMVYGDEELPKLTLEVGRLAIIDLDRDGVNEMVVWPVDTLGERDDPTEIGYSTGYFVFRRQGDVVQVYYPGWRSIDDLKADGTFVWGGSALTWGIGRAQFTENGFELEKITWRSDSVDDDAYFVNGLKATREDFDAAIAAQDAKPDPIWYVFEDGQLKALSTTAINVPIPLDGAALSIPVPDFLDADQQLLYRQMYSLYSHIFGFSTDEVDSWPGQTGYGYGPGDTIERSGMGYVPATGLYANWSDFEEAVLSVFTQDFWNSRNGADGFDIYINEGGTLYYVAASMGGGECNSNFPATFRLVEQTGDAISFIMTAYYSEPYPMEGESYEERDARLASYWEYSVDFPIRMVRTENGWRFDEFHMPEVDSYRQPFSSQHTPNPNPPGMDIIPAPSAAEVCVHGFDHVYVSTLDGTDNSRKIHTAQDTSMIFRCLEDGFTYVVPAPVTGRDYWFGGGWEDDFDGDGHIEEAILRENAELIMVCDAQDGLLQTCTVDTGSLIDAFNQDLSYRWTDDGQTMTIDLSYQGQRLQARFTGQERELILSYGDENVPTADRGNGYPEPFTGQDLILTLPVYLTGSVDGDSTVLLGSAQWTFRYSGGAIAYVPGSFRLTAAPSVDLPISWTV